MGGNNSGNVKQLYWVTKRRAGYGAALPTDTKPSLVEASGMRAIGQGIPMPSGYGQLLCMLYLDQ